ncbi:MAG: GNAT family N-acetyltransferase [bacterium]
MQLNPYPEIKTESLLLRRITDKDAIEVFTIRSSSIISEHLDRPLCKSIDEANQFIDKINNSINNNELYYWGLTLKDFNSIIGTICLWRFNQTKTSAEIGYELLPQYHGKAYMQQAIEAVINFAFNTLNMTYLFAEVAPANIKSIKILQKFGFVLKDTSLNQINPKTVIFELESIK